MMRSLRSRQVSTTRLRAVLQAGQHVFPNRPLGSVREYFQILQQQVHHESVLVIDRPDPLSDSRERRLRGEARETEKVHQQSKFSSRNASSSAMRR